jgi:hypothetical protein
METFNTRHTWKRSVSQRTLEKAEGVLKILPHYRLRKEVGNKF